MTREHNEILARSFASVKVEYCDLDGLSWDTSPSTKRPMRSIGLRYFRPHSHYSSPVISRPGSSEPEDPWRDPDSTLCHSPHSPLYNNPLCRYPRHPNLLSRTDPSPSSKSSSFPSTFTLKKGLRSFSHSYRSASRRMPLRGLFTSPSSPLFDGDNNDRGTSPSTSTYPEHDYDSDTSDCTVRPEARPTQNHVGKMGDDSHKRIKHGAREASQWDPRFLCPCPARAAHP